MNFPRSGGILLHPTSLPGPYGIGDLGPQAYRFVDFLVDSGCKLGRYYRSVQPVMAIRRINVSPRSRAIHI